MSATNNEHPAARTLAESAPFADWPKDDVAHVDERSMLTRFLDYQRAVLARKALGLTDEQARIAACPPSKLTMLGLVRHLAGVERGWAQRTLLGLDVAPLYATKEHPDAEFHPSPDATLADALDVYWAEIAMADRIYAEASLDDIVQRGYADYSVRWVLIHLVEEYARHCGQADLIREAIDGTTGD